MKLAGSSWGANTEILQTSAMALCYSASEYSPSLVTVSSHWVGWCTVELHHASHLWYSTFHHLSHGYQSSLTLNLLRRKAATNKLVERIIARDNWPIHSDIANPPHACLPSRKPLWQDLVRVDIRSQRKENWKSAQVVNFSLVFDPTIRQPGFDLPRQQWPLLNRFRTAEGYCGACKKKWNQAATDLCPCGEKQTMSHIIDSCPRSKLQSSLSQLHSADDEADAWLIRYGP